MCYLPLLYTVPSLFIQHLPGCSNTLSITCSLRACIMLYQ